MELSSIILFYLVTVVSCFRDASRLYSKLMESQNYNKLIRPVDNNSETLTVYLGLRLSQLIDVDEKNQIVTTNVWVEQEWHDVNLIWNPDDYSGVKMLYIPSEYLWLPDIVLYNNADGHYELKIMTKATVFSNGLVRWVPPAVYKSSCIINVEFFPFDTQDCLMTFGSWTYDGYKVNLKHIMQKKRKDLSGRVEISYAIDLKDFYTSVEFDILGLTAERFDNTYPCCSEPYPEVSFHINLRRKTLFYTVNLIMPCVAISFLTVLVFYLPSQSGEKISLSISILLSLTVFFLLLAEIIPPTSLVIPLIGKYLLFTMILVSLSIIVTVIVLNIHFRSPDTHSMPNWFRKIFIHILPKLLMVRRPQQDEIDPHIKPPEWEWGMQGDLSTFTFASPVNEEADTDFRDKFPDDASDHSMAEEVQLHHRNVNEPFTCEAWDGPSIDALGNTIANSRVINEPHTPNGARRHASQRLVDSDDDTEETELDMKIRHAIEGVRFIAEHLKEADLDRGKREDWKYVAMVIDRLFLWIFTTACVLSSMGIILQAPALYDYSAPMTSDNLPNFTNLVFYEGKSRVNVRERVKLFLSEL